MGGFASRRAGTARKPADSNGRLRWISNDFRVSARAGTAAMRPKPSALRYLRRATAFTNLGPRTGAPATAACVARLRTTTPSMRAVKAAKAATVQGSGSWRCRGCVSRPYTISTWIQYTNRDSTPEEHQRTPAARSSRPLRPCPARHPPPSAEGPCAGRRTSESSSRNCVRVQGRQVRRCVTTRGEEQSGQREAGDRPSVALRLRCALEHEAHQPRRR